MLKWANNYLAAGVLLLAPLPLWANPSEIVDTAYVEQALARGAIVWDARDAGEYAEGHIPGAVNFGAVGSVLRNPTREELLSAAQAEKIFGQAGVDPVAREVVIYARKGDPNAYYGLWAMRYYGAKQAKVYHGGIDAWTTAGKPLAKEATKLPPTTVKLAVQENVVLWNREMLDRVRSGGDIIPAWRAMT
jgi:thiosulfate/3-mercaptopyruvate sulfurtransferase